MKSILKKACSLCLAAILLCSAVPMPAVAEDLMIDSKPPVVSSEPINIQPWANGELLLEVPDLATATKNQETGAIYTQAFGNEAFYTYNTEKGTMNSLAVGGSATTVSYGGKTNLLLNEKSKYTVSYLATTTSVAGGGGLRISYASNSSSIGFYAHAGGEKGCLAWGANTTNGYSGYKSYTKDMKKRGTVYQHDGFAKFDIEIDGFVISGYLNDVLCFRENIQAPSNASAKSGIANDYMSETLTLVWSEYVSADQTAGTPSTEIKDLKVYAGLLHQEVYDLSVIGMQVGTTADGKRNVRFVAGGNTDTYAAAGMEITAILDSG
ncbi:MAG: hypothetical protein IKC59_05830, partial [Clostridia bacterium]|nr:hypothetical protein [Clostridia bacterium]